MHQLRPQDGNPVGWNSSKSSRPTNPTGAVEAELQHLTMSSRAHLSEYLVRFNTLASRVEWGDAALCFQFYDSLPDQLKDQTTFLRKPNTLQELVQVTVHHDNLSWSVSMSTNEQNNNSPPVRPQSDK